MYTKVGEKLVRDTISEPPAEITVGFDLLRCSCGASFFFAPSEKDKPIPLCAESVPNGNIFIREGKAIYVSKRNPLPDGADRFQSHFADCPKADQFRTKE